MRVKNNIKVNRKRIYFLFILFLVTFFLIIYRLVSIQYINASEFKSYAEFQHTGEFVISSKRGKILDRNGIELATSLIEKTVYADPRFVEDSEYGAEVLAGILGLDESEVKQKLDNKESGFEYIKRKVSLEKAEEILEYELPGIYFQDEAKRYYPQNDIAASIIGFTGTDNNGLSGIELQYEKVLGGVDGKEVIEKDVFGNIIPGENNTYIEPVDGKDIVLTIDSQIQYIAQEKLQEIVTEYNALRAIAVVMNPENGEIYAMASYPGFDLNNYQEADAELYKILGIHFTYEPGSTFKIINVASALESNSIGSDWLFDLPPTITIGDKQFEEISRNYSVSLTTKEIIKQSSNIGAITIALSMGKRNFWEGIKNFGFGEMTGIELPGEEVGIFYNYEKWNEPDIGALAIGQCISVTPLQLLRAVCAIANGGYLVEPSIVKEVELLENGENNDMEVGEGKRILSPETTNAMKDMMLSVVEEGTGTKARIEDVEVCGKTGTAEKVNSNGIGYDEGRCITSFIGFAPYEDPEVAVLVVVDEPQGWENTVWGGTVAAPVFREIMEFSLKRLRV
jgi:stage V sporulation protein D (sporulation-specific penicillin-binding protein)